MSMLYKGLSPIAGLIPEQESVSVTADGVKTYSALLDELHSLVDISKISNDSYIAINKMIHHLFRIYNNEYQYTAVTITSQKAYTIRIIFRGTNSKYDNCSNTYSDDSSSVPSSGDVITLYY